MLLRQRDEILSSSNRFRSVAEVSIDFKQVVEVSPLTFAVVDFSAEPQSSIERLFGLTFASRVEKQFAEPPVKKRLILSGRMALKRLGSFDESARLNDQCIVFQTV